MKSITPEDLKTKLDTGEPVQVLDTRETDKFAAGHIAGSLNIPQSDLPEFMHLVATDRPVVICCQYGVKSQAPYLYLTEKKKMKNIYILEGGLYQWSSEYDPDMTVL